jgi:hypothetical protein
MRIDEMPAGREMDALVAEKVMGNKLEYGCFVDDRYADDCVTDICDCAIAESLHKEKDKFPDKCQYWRELDPLPYSTDIAAAWEVLNKFTHKEPCINYLNDLWNPVGWHCHIDGHHTEGCDTAPLAICRCALKVAGVAEI